MENNENLLVVNSPGIGEFKIIASDDQISQILHEGATELQNSQTVNETTETDHSLDWLFPDQIGSKPVEGGFVGNKIDWSQYFPNANKEEIETLIAQALDKNKKIQIASKIVLSLLGVGLTSVLSGGVPVTGIMVVTKIVGSYFQGSDNAGTDTDTKA